MGERFDNLRKMLKQVDPSLKAEGLGQALESRSAMAEGPDETQESFPLKAEGGVREARWINVASVETELALESLELLKKGDEVDETGQYALEAIVMPYYRPVVDIIDDKMKEDQLTAKWRHLTADWLQPQIEECFLSVGQIRVPNLPSLPYAGTGFVVGDGLLMTNRHVASIFAEGLGRTLRFHAGQVAAVDFYRENGRKSPATLSVKAVLMIHPYWDMALLRVEGLPEKRKPLSLLTADPSALVDREVVVVGYPGYDPTNDQEFQNIQSRIFRNTYYVKRLQPGMLKVRDQIASFNRVVDVVTHDSSTLGGNSGSAVLLLPRDPSEPIQVVGLHFAGKYLVSNYAVSAYDLAQDSRVVDAGVKFDASVAPRKDLYDSIWSDLDLDGEHVKKPDPPAPVAKPEPTLPVGNPIQPVTGVSLASPQLAMGTSVWTIPLQISVSLGTPQAVVAPPSVAMPAQPEGLFGGPKPPSAATFTARFSASSLTKTSFDWNAALSLALASNLSYGIPSAIQATARTAWGFESCLVIDKDYTQCFVASSAGATVVAFRGTASLGDWLANLDVWSITQPYGTVHRGFHTAFSIVKPQIEQELRRVPHRRVVVTGHSLGGTRHDRRRRVATGLLDRRRLYIRPTRRRKGRLRRVHADVL